LERAVAAAGRWLIAGPGVGLIGATMGFKVAALFTGGFINGIIKIGKLNDEVKRKIGDQITGRPLGGIHKLL
jgi:hypothetical protein